MIRRFTEIAEKFNLIYNLDKCIFLAIFLDLWGYTVSESKLKSNPERFWLLMELPLPQDMNLVHHVIGKFSYYSC